jgi:hypothetical protein
MTKRGNHRPSRGRARLAVPTGADTPDRVRKELVEEVRRRLESGELDSDLARVETAFALLDGDPAASGAT